MGRRIRTGRIGITLAMVAIASGCVSDLNDEPTIGGTWLPPTFDPRDDAVFLDETQPAEPASITSLDRSEWPRTRIVVPNALPAHQPTYTQSWFATNHRLPERRRTGRYPNQTSALQMPDADDAKAQAREGVVAPFAAALDIVLFPVRFFVTPPWATTRSGTLPYERAPRVQTIVPDAPVPADAPAAPPMPPAEPLYGEDAPPPPPPAAPSVPPTPSDLGPEGPTP